MNIKMSKSAKIVIGIVVAAIVIWLGYLFLGARNSNANQNAGNNTDQGVIMSTGNPYDAEHLQRTLNSGGVPGDGGGG